MVIFKPHPFRIFELLGAKMDSCYDLKTILKLKSIRCIDYVVTQKLQKFGVKSVSRVSERSVVKTRKESRNGVKSTFGVSLECESQSTERIVIQDHTVCLPKFFVMAVTFLNNHVTCEGIFRKAGSITRQKALRATINAGHVLPTSTSPHDVAALLKQYLRELPDPLLTNRLYPVFNEIIRSNYLTKTDKEDLILLSCLLLPEQHLLCLKVLMKLLHKIAGCSQSHSLMDSESLALVVSPNILSSFDGLGSSRKESVCFDLKSTSDTTKVLIDKADYICKVPVELFNTEDNSDKTRLDSHTPRLDSHTPWKGNVSDKIRGTWTRIMGKRNGYLKSDEETSMSKRPALDESDDAIFNTPSVFGTAKRQRKMKSTNSTLARKKKRQGISNFTTLFSTPAKSKLPDSIITVDNTSTSKNCSMDDLVSSPFSEVTSESLAVSIGQRVRKRRQHDRDLTQSRSNNCIKASQVNPELPVSQSDSHLFHKKVTPVTGTRPKLAAIFRRKTTNEKRKGFIHEPGLDSYTVPKKQRKSKNVKDDDNVRLVTSDDDQISVNSISLKDNMKGDETSPRIFTDSADELDSSFSFNKAPPIFRSPGLLRKVTSEITEMFQLTPKQLAPMTNNDSYLFAVEDVNEDWNYSSLSPKRGPLEIDDVLTNNTSPAQLTAVQPLMPITRANTFTCTKNKKNSVAKIQSSPFPTTPLTKSKRSSAWSGKLSRRAKQYMVTSENYNPSLRKKSVRNKQEGGVQVSQWIV